MTRPTKKTVAIVQTQAENAGAQEVARQLADGFEKRGWRTRQIFFYRRTDSFDDDSNVFFCADERPNTPLALIRMAARLYGEFRRAKPDVVMTLQHYGNLVGSPVARAAGVPTIIANQLSAMELISSKINAVDRLWGQIGLYDHIVVNSGKTEAAYLSYPRAYRGRLARIDHGFFDKSAPIPKAEARARLGLPQDVELLGCAARLSPLKQVDLAVRVLAENPGQHLALAGHGEEQQRLAALAQSLGVSNRVHFLGELNVEQMGAFLAALDCFVFPSAAESFGLAPVEAAQAGVPVVANDIEVLREVLAVDGASCALFVNAQDTKAFAAAVRRVFDDSALKESLTSVGRRLCERYPLDEMIAQYLQLMEGRPS